MVVEHHMYTTHNIQTSQREKIKIDDDDYFLMAKKQKTENKSRIASLPMVSAPVLFSGDASVSDTLS